MRNGPPPNAAPLAAMADELVERLARLEEQMRHVVTAVERLANRDTELDASVRALSDRFTSALSGQAEVLRESLEEVTDKFVTRDDWVFWKNLLTTGFIALIAFGWNALISGFHR
jgi:predicted nuclease with TOPRIM domain